ncbi:HGxxPAAW family protein [Streptomyces sp. NPDC047071]|uniref:HGxxPAAW family protein n=1 Tax=Streptomyces sp. NPDC047071 TaxID=3154808 RepID=UPI0034566F08
MSTHDDGHTIAGWTGCAVGTVGALIAGVGITGWRPGIWLGLGVMALAVFVTWFLHLAGWGKGPGPRPASQRPMRLRDSTARAGHPGCVGCRLAGRRSVAPGAAVAPSRRESEDEVATPVA